MPLVTIYSRRNCHLCADAEATVRELRGEIQFDLEVIDIDSDQSLVSQFGEEVPVTFVDGKRHDFFRVDRERLKNALLHPHQ